MKVGNKMSRIKLSVVIIISVSVLLFIIFTIQYCLGNSNKFEFHKFFNDNKDEFTRFADLFFEQDKVVSITRYDLITMGLTYGIRKNYLNDEANYISIEVPRKYRKNEDEFWRKDMTQIMASKGNGTISLGEFFQKAKMTELEFHTWRKFLKEYSFIYIDKDEKNELVTIGLTQTTGFIYRKDTTIHPRYRDEKLVRLNDNWVYYDERIK